MLKKWLAVAVLLATVGGVFAQEAATITNDEGGVTRVFGTLPIANPNVKVRSDVPLILLEDQTAFIMRDLKRALSPESQVVGRWVTDFFAEGDVAYEILLPIVPQGTAHDVDNNGEEDAGVQVFQVAYWDNVFGDITLDDREARGWSVAYSSVKTSINPATLYEITGGRLIVYASEEGQGFPSGFGEDGKLFTEDDPIVILPAGYSVVNLDEEPFTFDRSASVEVNLLEPDGYAPDNFADLSYTEAWDALIEKAKNEYAFTDFKGIDWDAISAQFRPAIEAAEANQDAQAFGLVLADFVEAIPDGHMSFETEQSNAAEQAAIAGGVGLAIRELTDGTLRAIRVVEDSPADRAGIKFGAEIIAIDGLPIEEAIANAYTPNRPYSTPSIERLDLVRFVTRFPLGKGKVDITFKNPDSEEEQTVTLDVIGERTSLSFTRQFVYGQPASVPLAPITWRFLPDTGYGYVQITAFEGNVDLFKKQWEAFLQTANAFGSEAIIVDIRQNGGGSSGIAALLTSYLITEPIMLEYGEQYNKDLGAFFRDPAQDPELEPTRNLSAQYTGKVVALISPACFSACEFFAYYLQQAGIDIMGVYGTNGIAGGYIETEMPEGYAIALPTFRSVDVDGNIIIEGVGIQPNLRIAITEENMASTDDFVLAEAIAYLESATALDIVDGGSITGVGEVSGTISAGQVVEVRFNSGDGGVFNFVVTSDAGAYSNIYATTGELLADGTTPTDPGWEGVELPAGFDLVFRIVTDGNAGEGSYTFAVEIAE
jgi:C-terminal processing protease CtpA/Prc